MGKKISFELGFFIIKLAIAFSLLPLILTSFDFRSSKSQINKVEQLFLIEFIMIILFVSLIVLYVVRFLLSILLAKLGVGGKPQKAP
jgi:hypothetical protein